MGLESLYYPTLSTLPEKWWRGSFTEIGILWLESSNFFSPSDCKIRQITDKGSIRASMTDSAINLFDRQLEGRTRTRDEVLKKVFISLGLLTIVPPLGGLWHLSESCYHGVFWISDQ